jgi:hypothetical protein
MFAQEKPPVTPSMRPIRERILAPYRRGGRFLFSGHQLDSPANPPLCWIADGF